MLSTTEVAQHNNRQSCWVIIEGHAYDVTDFLDDHPGGSGAILRYAGKVRIETSRPMTCLRVAHSFPSRTPPRSSFQYTLQIHLKSICQKVRCPFLSTDPFKAEITCHGSDKHLGPVDMSTVPTATKEDLLSSATVDSKDVMPLKLCQNLLDIEVQASKVLTERAYTYFHSAADSLNSLETNRRDWARVTFRPRVMRNVARADMTCDILGQKSRLPFFISPMAMIKLANPEGEVGLARAAGAKGIPYAVSTYSSCSHEEIMETVRSEGLPQLQFFQLYVPRKPGQGAPLVKKARELGFKALLITVDTPVVGKREEDEQYKARVDYQAGVEDSPRTLDTSVDVEQPILRGVHSSTLNWDDLDWIRQAWGDAGPIVLKGIQCAEDARLAYDMGIQAIYLSNHGGRQLDFAPSAVQTLLEIRRFCPEILGKMEIYLDGGVRRGTDVLKALCLGATAVGIGRPFVYALGAYGREGAMRAIERKYCMHRPLAELC